MATTIITKHTNGSGAPTPDKVSVGELAIDLVGQQLYTKDNSGDVIKLGSGKGSGNIADGTDQGQTAIWNSTDEEWQANSTLNVIGTNVGIGTNSSSTRGTLTVEGNSGASPYVALDHTNATSGRRYNLYSGTNYPGNFGIYDATAGEYRFQIDASGNVGIGTDNPSSMLEIVAPNSSFRARTSYADDVGNHFTVGSWASKGTISASNCPIRIDTYSADPISFWTNAGAGTSERMRIDAQGRVGIGTDSPEYNLSVVSNTGTATIGFKDSGTSVQGKIRIRSQSENLEFITGGGVRQTIDEQGRVGIGGTPSRSTKEIEDEAVATLASWEPKDTKDKKPTKAELIQQLTERNIGGGSALLQVAGNGFFSGKVIATGIYRASTGNTSGIGFGGNSDGPALVPNDHTGSNADGTVNVGLSNVRFKDAHFSGTVNADIFTARAFTRNTGGVSEGILLLPGAIVPCNGTSTAQDNTINLGQGGAGVTPYRFKDAYFSGDVSCATINGALPFNTRHIIETLETLRDATKDETTLEGLRDSIGNAVGGLIEKFEAMQNSAVTQDIQD